MTKSQHSPEPMSARVEVYQTSVKRAENFEAKLNVVSDKREAEPMWRLLERTERGFLEKPVEKVTGERAKRCRQEISFH